MLPVKVLSELVVVGFGAFLVGVAAMIATRRGLAERFLNGFASSARAHFVEQALRLTVGASLIVSAPWMRHPELFRLFGWLLVLTTLMLLLLPWRWHHRFAQYTIPALLRHPTLFALGAFALGGWVLWGVFHEPRF